MERIPNNKSKDASLCSITGCDNHRVYYYPQKNLKLCISCWQDFLIDTDLDKIDTPDYALLTMKKIDTWLSTMKKYGASYYITKIYDNFYIELGKYEQILDQIRGKLDKAQQDDDFMEYPKIEHEALELLKQLLASNVMHNYKSYFAQMSINIIANKNYIEVQDPFESEIRDKKFAKMKEDLTKELTQMNSKTLEEEQKKLSDQFNQICEIKKKRIEELEITVREKQKVIEEYEITVSDKKEKIDQLSQKIDDQMKNIEELKITVKNEKNQIDQLNKNFEDQKKKTDELEIKFRDKKELIDKQMVEINCLKKDAESFCEMSKCNQDELTNKNSKLINEIKNHEKSISKLNDKSREDKKNIDKLKDNCKQKDNTIDNLNEDKKKKDETIEQLNDEIKSKESIIDKLKNEKKDNDNKMSKIKLGMKKHEDCIDKLNEESKIQKTEIGNMLEYISLTKEYLPQFYKSKTGRDGKTGADFYLQIDWDKDNDKQVFQVAKCVKFTEISKIHFGYLKNQNNKEVLDYLVANCPDKLKIFALDANTSYGSAEYYIEGIKKVASVTSKEVFIRFFKFSKSDFEQTVKASANSQRIVFCCCVFDPEADFDFTGPAYATSYLGFRYVGNQAANSWETHPERLKRIVKAISECSLKDSLNTIDVGSCNLEVAEVEKMLDEFSLKDKIKVVKESGVSLNE